MRQILTILAAAIMLATAAAAAEVSNPDLPNGGFALDVEYNWEQGRREVLQDHSGEASDQRVSVSVLKALSPSLTAEVGVAGSLYREPRLQVIKDEEEYSFAQCTPDDSRHSIEIRVRLRFYFGQSSAAKQNK